MPSSNRTTYRDLFAIPTFPRLATSVMLARTASQMMLLTLVLFVLQRFHSPSLAGITVFLAIAPGVRCFCYPVIQPGVFSIAISSGHSRGQGTA